MANSQYECFIGTSVWFRTNGCIKNGVVKAVKDDGMHGPDFVIMAKRIPRLIYRIPLKNVFETKESLLADDYRLWRAEVDNCKKCADSPEKLLKILYAAADMTEEMRLAVRSRAVEFFGIELDEEAAKREREICMIIGEED